MKKTRRVIIDATVAVIARSGYAGLTVAAIAAEAGVTRPTVYSNFGTLPVLVSTAVAERSADLLMTIAAHIDDIDNAADYAVEFIVRARAAIRSDRVLTDVLYAATEARMLDADVVDRGLALTGPMVAHITSRSPGIDDPYGDLPELLVRISLSAIIFRSNATDSDDGLRRMVHRMIDPLLIPPARR